MLGSNIEPPQPTKVKKLGLTGSASSEFAKRFMTKPTRQPKVIDFNAGNLQADKKRRGINGFFPPMKLRNSAKEPKTSSSGDIKINVEHRDSDLCIDSVTKPIVTKPEEKAEDIGEQLKLSEIKPIETTEPLAELTHTNLTKQFPKHISIPIVEETETNESSSTRALDSAIQFKLPPVIISEISENTDKKMGTRVRCKACNNHDQSTFLPNIWLIHDDLETTELHYEDFTNAILGHFPMINFRLRRELTVYWDRHPGLKRFFELPQLTGVNNQSQVLEKSNTETSVVLQHNLGKHKVDAMRYMTREIYTNLKLSQSSTRTKEDRLQLVPTSYSEVRPRSNTSRAVSRASRRSVGLRKSPESARTIPANPSENYLPYADTFDCDDLSVLPPPKRILPRRDVPWVFRYKVKKNMNELSKILASKPQQAIENL